MEGVERQKKKRKKERMNTSRLAQNNEKKQIQLVVQIYKQQRPCN